MTTIHVTVPGPAETIIPIPSWYGYAATMILLLSHDPHALDRIFPSLDIDAVHRNV